MERVSLKPCRMREYIGQWPKDRKFFLGEVFREKNTFVFLKKKQQNVSRKYSTFYAGNLRIRIKNKGQGAPDSLRYLKLIKRNSAES